MLLFVFLFFNNAFFPLDIYCWDVVANGAVNNSCFLVSGPNSVLRKNIKHTRFRIIILNRVKITFWLLESMGSLAARRTNTAQRTNSDKMFDFCQIEWVSPQYNTWRRYWKWRNPYRSFSSLKFWPFAWQTLKLYFKCRFNAIKY